MMKKIRKKIAFAVACLLVVTNVTAYGNEQLPVKKLNIDNVFFSKGENALTGSPIIKPTISISWENPDRWSTYPEGSTEHDPAFYDIVVKNVTTSVETEFRIPKGSTEFTDQALNLEDFITLETGTLYEVQVEPNHYEDVNGVSTVISPVPATVLTTREYVVTDLDTEFISSEDSIQVIWEDLGPAEMNYRIVYALGDYTNKSKADLVTNKDGEISNLNNTRNDVISFVDPADGRKKLSYTINQNLAPGQIYSVLVEPTTEYYEQKAVKYNKNYPQIKLASTTAVLDLIDEGEFIRLEWSIPDSFVLGSVDGSHTIQKAVLYEIINGQESTGVIFQPEAVKEGYYKFLTPTKETTYRMDFYYDNATSADGVLIVKSTEVSYTPSELMIIPSAPVIPILMTPDIVNDWDEDTDLIEPYLIPEDEYDVDEIEKILDSNVTFHINENEENITQSTINLPWSAFSRLDVARDSDTYDEMIYDYNIYYDIWITDYLSDMNSAIRFGSDLKFDATDNENIIMKNDTIIGYSLELNQYYSHDEKDMVEGITPNKIYYIKIVAKKKTVYGEFVSTPTFVSVYFDYEGNYYAPPTIARPPLYIVAEETTDSAVSIAWEEKWYEIISPDYVEGDFGYDWAFAEKVWVDGSGKTYNYYVSGGEEFEIYRDEDEIKRLQTYLNDNHGISLIYREVDLSGDDFTSVKYKFVAVPYEDVIANGSVVAYYSNLVEQDLLAEQQGNPSVFEYIDVEPYGDGQLHYQREGLAPNTSYLFLIYPYRVLLDGQQLRAHYPTPIIVATDPEEGEINPDPKVPRLVKVTSRDTEIDLKWKYNYDFKYSLVYSLEDDVDTAIDFEVVLPDESADDYPVNGEYYTYTVNDLFPDTDYYFWIKAKNIRSSKESEWSNPVSGNTLDVEKPYQPKGVGIASLESMKKYDYDESITDEYVAIEWVLHTDDIERTNDSKVVKAYSYIIEVADNAKFIAPDYIVSSGGSADVVPSNVELLEKSLVKINELVPNRAYYIRLKTKLTVTGSEPGQLIEKESTYYSNTVKIITEDSGEEYDGQIDPEFEILPDEDYEMGYDSTEDTLFYRFRSDKTGTNGRDNGTDQRFISKLITENTVNYNIDVAGYYNQPIENRVIEIPYTVMEALNENKVDVTISAGDIEITIPENTLAYEINRQKNLFNVAPEVEISIDKLRPVDIKLPTNGMDLPTYLGEIKVVIKSNKTYKILKSGEKKIEFVFKGVMDQPVVYTSDHNNDWEEEDAYIGRNTGKITIQTNNFGKVLAGELKETSVDTSAPKHWSDKYRNKVFENYFVEGAANHLPEAYVTEKELINVAYGLILDEKMINLDDKISEDTMKMLYKAGIKANTSSSGASISREEAISMFIRAYEIHRGSSILPDTALLKSANANGTISSGYKADIAKAATIGLISDINKVRPKDKLKFGELYAIWTRY